MSQIVCWPLTTLVWSLSAPASIASAQNAPPAPGAAASAENAAALRAVQELDAKVIELRRELDALERSQQAVGDLRRIVDELEGRVREMARQPPAGAPSPPPPAQPQPQPQPRESALVTEPLPLSGVRVSGWIQPGYEGALVNRAIGQAAAPNRSGFLARRVKLRASGHVLTDRFGFAVQIDPLEAAVLDDAFVLWRFGKAVGLRAGRFKVPFSFQRYAVATRSYELVDRSETTYAFAFERDTGVMIVGRPLAGRLQYQLAAHNGSGRGLPNDNFDLAYTARVVGQPLGALPDEEGDAEHTRRPLFSVGASVHYNLLPTDIRARTGNPDANIDVDGDGGVDNVSVWQIGGEARALWRGIAVAAEYFWRREDAGAAGGRPNARRDGAYVQASYYIIPRVLQVAARWGETEHPLYGRPLREREERGAYTREHTGGVSYFMRGHDLKVQIDYSRLADRKARWTDAEGAAVEFSDDRRITHRLRIQAQVGF